MKLFVHNQNDAGNGTLLDAGKMTKEMYNDDKFRMGPLRQISRSEAISKSGIQKTEDKKRQ